MCDVDHHKSFGLERTAFNELYGHIFITVGDIFVYLYQWLYNILFLVLSFMLLTSLI